MVYLKLLLYLSPCFTQKAGVLFDSLIFFLLNEDLLYHTIEMEDKEKKDKTAENGKEGESEEVKETSITEDEEVFYEAGMLFTIVYKLVF